MYFKPIIINAEIFPWMLLCCILNQLIKTITELDLVEYHLNSANLATLHIGGGEFQTQKPSVRARCMDIFWNNTFGIISKDDCYTFLVY